MLKSKKYLKIFLVAVFLLLAVVFLSNFVLAAGVNTGIEFGAGTGLSNSQDIRVTIAKIIRIVIGFLGIIAVGLIMYAGWMWMTSEGNEEKIDQAKKIITNAAIGLLIILSAFAIVSFIINALGGGSGGSGNNNKAVGNQGSFGMSAFENGAIESVYPTRGQLDVPRNTSILITFKQPINPDSLISGGKINAANVKITKSGDPHLISDDMDIFATFTPDFKTFIFTPAKYLGSPSEKVWHTVSLTLANIKKQADGKAITNNWSEWNFEVSTKIDLTPPQVKQIKDGGVNPAPDNARDSVDSTSFPGAKATGKIEIKNKPNIYSDAAVVSTVKSGGSGDATAAVDKNCDKNGALTVEVSTNKTFMLKNGATLLGQGTVNGKVISFDLCNLKLTLADVNYAAGNLWTINLRAMIAADTLTVGNYIYTASTSPSITTFKVDNDNSATAINLFDVIRHYDFNVDTDPPVGAVITLTAKVLGSAGNNIILTSSDQNNIAASGMSGGTDKQEKVTVNSQPDVARNAVIRIDFNEAVNPMTVSGKSQDLINYIKVVNLNDNSVVQGIFKVSNQYKTVEFISNVECGVNACGEKIYCLPENAKLEVSFKAASLAPCDPSDLTNPDKDCASRSPYGTCDADSKLCKNADGNNYPLSNKPLNGVADLAANSLDGNRNDKAQGPVTYYNENIPAAADGDNFKWSFFVNNKINLTGPEILFTKQADKDGNEKDSNNGTGLQLYNSIIIYFNKIMMSSSLNTGDRVINNGSEDVTHKLINMWNFANKPLGYWISNESIDIDPKDNIPDQTKVYINHTGMVDAVAYRAQAGSGLRDMYQNCYKPSKGVGCTSGVDDNNPSCCSGTATADLPASGNCP